MLRRPLHPRSFAHGETEMAPGYLIALCLDGAGLLGLGIGLVVLRAERRDRAVGLQRFLRSGQVRDAAPLPTVPTSRTRPPRRVRSRAAASATVSLTDPSRALSALRSAYAAAAR